MKTKSKIQDVVVENANDNFRSNDVAVLDAPSNPLASKVSTKAMIAQLKAETDAKIKAIKDADKKAKEEAKLNKPPKELVLSAYGVATDRMCRNPQLTFEELKKECADRGFTKESAIRTAHVTAKKIYLLLKGYGFAI